MKFKKITATICVATILLSVFNPVYAETAPYTLPDDSDGEEVGEILEPLTLTVDSAVNYGLENNKSIEILENKIDLAMIASQNANSNAKDLKDAKKALQDAASKLFDKKKQLESAQNQIDQAKKLLAAGISPISLSFEYEGNQITISAGSKIPADYAEKITNIIESKLNSNQEAINESGIALNEAETTLKLKQEEFKAILSDASETLDTKINYGSLIDLDADDASKLMITMAGVNLNVTRYAKGIYKNQIAMLIKKNFYDALYAEKVLALKKIAMERGEKQYNMVKLSYENGMKAKDDMLLSKMYYDGTIVSCRLAEANYKNALTELKENMNLDMNVEIILQDSTLSEVTEESLDEGLKSGLTNRIEIQQALGQLAIYELNEDILNSRAEYKPYSKGIKEAKLLREGAEFLLDKTKTTVESEIYQSYETMVAAGDMLKASNDLIKNAEEVVKIANLKYQQGLGAENSLLKQMNLQESSGTIVELIAAQEKLSELEAQVAQIRYSYTMAKIKYYNDAGILVY